MIHRNTTRSVRRACIAGGLLGIMCFCVVALLSTSCSYHGLIGKADVNSDATEVSKIGEGMTDGEVSRLLGPPDDIRTLDQEHLLDGVRVLSSLNPTNAELRRWAYGVRQPGTFARAGVVSFDGHNRVIWTQTPLGHGPVSSDAMTRHPGGASKSLDGLSCRIDEISLKEARGETTRLWSAKVTIANSGNTDFSADCYVDAIQRQCAVQVYDKDQTLIFLDDHSNSDNGFGSRRSKFAIPAGAARTEELHFFPDSYFGPLPPGRYLLRVLFRRGEGSFIPSAMVEFAVPAFPKGSDYWDRFRERVEQTRKASAL